jgi:hypothetical protein
VTVVAPSGSDVVVQVASPAALTAADEHDPPGHEKVTVPDPAGTGIPDDETVVVEVRVTVWPGSAGFGDPATTVVVGVWVPVKVRVRVCSGAPNPPL